MPATWKSDCPMPHAVLHMALELSENTRMLTLVVCLLLAMSATCGRADPLDDLLRAYREYGLPEPPRNAPLVQFPSGWRNVGKDGKETPLLHLAFLLQPGNDKQPAIVLTGTVKHELQCSQADIVKVNPNLANLEKVRVTWQNSAFDVNIGLTTALQCKARGWDDLAQRLWDKSILEPSGHFRSPFYLPPKQAPKKALAATAWVHYMNQLMAPKTDRQAIEGRLKLLISKEPTLNTEGNRELLRNLKATLVPSSAKPGTPEALIDSLVELQGSRSIFADSYADDSTQRKLIELGFDAVPALIDHLLDQRLTRSYSAAFNNFAPRPIYVGEVAADIVQGLAGDEIGRDWLERQHGFSMAKAKAREWFAKAQNIGEEKYLLLHALPERAVEPDVEAKPNLYILRVLAKKYPARLPELYRRLLSERPEMESDKLAELIAKSLLSKAQKTKLFCVAAETSNLAQQVTALGQLRDLDGARFIDKLVKSLDSVQESSAKSCIGCPEIVLASMVADIDDLRVWKAFYKAAKRVDVRRRIEMLEMVGGGGRELTPSLQQKELAFLTAFLDDETARILIANAPADDNDDSFLTYSKFSHLEVRNFAAIKLAQLLDIADIPQPNWTANDWSEFRAKVKILALKKLENNSLPEFLRKS